MTGRIRAVADSQGVGIPVAGQVVAGMRAHLGMAVGEVHRRRVDTGAVWAGWDSQATDGAGIRPGRSNTPVAATGVGRWTAVFDRSVAFRRREADPGIARWKALHGRSTATPSARVVVFRPRCRPGWSC